MKIDKYIIKKQGSGFNIIDTTKKSQSVNSHCYLIHAIRSVMRLGDERVKVIAQDKLEALDGKLRANTESKKNDFEYMQNYRKIENEFYLEVE